MRAVRIRFPSLHHVLAPTRLLQGSRNAAAYFQMCIHTAIAELHDSVLQWLDDLHFHAQSEQALFSVLHSFFKICQRLASFCMLESVNFSHARPRFAIATCRQMLLSSTRGARMPFALCRFPLLALTSSNLFVPLAGCAVQFLTSPGEHTYCKRSSKKSILVPGAVLGAMPLAFP
jgi:hypothetical protein